LTEIIIPQPLLLRRQQFVLEAFGETDWVIKRIALGLGVAKAFGQVTTGILDLRGGPTVGGLSSIDGFTPQRRVRRLPARTLQEKPSQDHPCPPIRIASAFAQERPAAVKKLLEGRYRYIQIRRDHRQGQIHHTASGVINT